MFKVHQEWEYARFERLCQQIDAQAQPDAGGASSQPPHAIKMVQAAQSLEAPWRLRLLVVLAMVTAAGR